MAISNVTQRMCVHFSGNIETLRAVLSHVSADLTVVDSVSDKKSFRLFSAVDIVIDKSVITLEVKFNYHISLWDLA